MKFSPTEGFLQAKLKTIYIQSFEIYSISTFFAPSLQLFIKNKLYTKFRFQKIIEIQRLNCDYGMPKKNIVK
jgi:hypothetical protein